MPVIIIEMLETKNVEQKKQLVKDITDAFVKIGENAASVNVIIRENPKTCWATGGELCADFEIPPGA